MNRLLTPAAILLVSFAVSACDSNPVSALETTERTTVNPEPESYSSPNTIAPVQIDWTEGIMASERDTLAGN